MLLPDMTNTFSNSLVIRLFQDVMGDHFLSNAGGAERTLLFLCGLPNRSPVLD